MGWQPTYQAEGHIYAQYVLKNVPNAKIGILYQNDDYGKDYVKGLKDGLGDKAKTMIVAETPYETSDPTVDSQMVRLKASGADVFFNVTTPKFAAQAIKKAAEIGWQPVHLLNNVSQSVGSVLQPAGHQDQHQPDRLLSDRADADAALQRRALGIDRRGDERRGRRVAALSPGGLRAAREGDHGQAPSGSLFSSASLRPGMDSDALP